jgi:cytochrome c peroxidase
MRRIYLEIGLIFISFVFVSCGGNAKKSEKKSTAAVQQDKFAGLQKKATGFFGKLPKEADNPENPITPEKVALGKKLYFDKRLSRNNMQSCNTCHNLDTYGVDNLPTSPGDNGKPGTRNSPTTLNAALHVAQFWDGREPDVEAQAGGPILNPAEMAMPSESAVVKRLKKIKEYNKMFAAAFPDDANPISYDNLKKAIGAFERKLITPSRFDKYLAGDENALTAQEKEGLQTFVNTGCISCHIGNLLGGNMYQKFGVYGNYWDYTKSKTIDNGKYDVTKNENDKYVFKVPSLRNVEKTWPYFHDGSVKDLKEAVVIMGKTQLNKDFTGKQVDDLVAFMKTLTGKVPEEYKQ